MTAIPLSGKEPSTSSAHSKYGPHNHDDCWVFLRGGNSSAETLAIAATCVFASYQQEHTYILRPRGGAALAWGVGGDLFGTSLACSHRVGIVPLAARHFHDQPLHTCVRKFIYKLQVHSMVRDALEPLFLTRNYCCNLNCDPSQPCSWLPETVGVALTASFWHP